jgi:tetratricopeptide (TPR) repeat protein
VVAAIWLSWQTPPATAALPAQDDPAVEAHADSLLRSVWVHLYDGRLDLARRAAERVAVLVPGDPRVGLAHFRVLRVDFPDDVHEEERAKRQMPAIMAVLDGSIAQCDSMIAGGSHLAAAYLYRGWSHMMKAQTHAIAGEYWSAGSESRKGKKDLNRFYELHPAGDPDASAIWGGYLYFADILPGIVKFLKWIIRVPGGDKEQGLALLEEATRGDGYTQRDTELVLGVIYYLFEGRVKLGATMFERLARMYPWHPRLVELRASTSLLYPESTMEALAIESRVIEQWNERVRGWNDLFFYRLRWSRARLRHQVGEYDEAMRELRAIAEQQPPHPFWITPRSVLSLADLELNLGRRDTAQIYCARILDDPALERYHDAAEELCEKQPAAREIAVFTELGPARQALYGGDLAGARELLDRLILRHGHDVRLRFFEAELARLQKQFDVSETAYREVVKQAEGDGLEPLRMVSLLRIGEMNIERRQYEAAEVTYKEARKMEPRATMLGTMIRGRLRFLAEQKAD